ncbi:MAG: hypothetical protein ABJG41_20955 [Cyclobacteriaceae bacterium]
MAITVIAESGSTKTDWRLITEDGLVEDFLSNGINPVLQPIEGLMADQQDVLKQMQKYNVDALYFYGAGCSQEDNKQKLIGLFSQFFPSAHVQVESDLVAAGKALFGDQKGIACILGTGSNSCLYDNGVVVQNVSSLGYILGDEGGGAQIGKRLMSDFLRKKMPENQSKSLEDLLGLSQSEIYQKVYQDKYPNRFLASIVGYLAPEYAGSAYFSQIVTVEFELFFDNCLAGYASNEDYRVGFVGSIAHFFEKELRLVAETKKFKIEKIIRKPIDQLVANQYQKNSDKTTIRIS